MKLVKPKIALIGVGKNNLYGHPSFETIKSLNILGVYICRTDEDGEISVMVNSRGKIKMNKLIN